MPEDLNLEKIKAGLNSIEINKLKNLQEAMAAIEKIMIYIQDPKITKYWNAWKADRETNGSVFPMGRSFQGILSEILVLLGYVFESNTGQKTIQMTRDTPDNFWSPVTQHSAIIDKILEVMKARNIKPEAPKE